MTTTDTAAAQWHPPDLTDTTGPSAQNSNCDPHDQIDGFPCAQAPSSNIPESTVLAATAMLRCAEDLCDAARKLLSPFSGDAANRASAARDAAVDAANAAEGLSWN